jgi:hypothetical protein
VETALIVAVPEAERYIGKWRRRYTSDGARGMPAHIHPPLSIHGDRCLRVGDGRSRRANPFVERIPKRVGPIRFSPTSTALFDGTRTLYLTPEPTAPFAAMTEGLVRESPEYQPYAGAFEDIVPHLTVARHNDPDVLADVERDVAPALPIRAVAVQAQLFENAPAPMGWRRRRAFRLR